MKRMKWNIILNIFYLLKWIFIFILLNMNKKQQSREIGNSNLKNFDEETWKMREVKDDETDICEIIISHIWNCK